MDNTKKLENRIKELEYRLGVLERFLDEAANTIHLNNDESLMNSIKIEIMNKTGMRLNDNKNRLGTKFHNE